MTTKYNFVLNQGETFDTTFTVLLQDRRPYDLTDYTVRGQIRETYTSATPLAAFTIEVVEPTSGRIRTTLTAAQTAALVFNKAVYDIEAENTQTGTVIRLVQGVVTLSREVTK